MPTSNELRQARRDAVRIFTRIGQSLPTPERLSRDAGKEVVEEFLEKVMPRVDTAEEMDELKRAISLWNGECEQVLFLPTVLPLPCLQHEPAEAPAPGPAKVPRVHCADLQLTFNGDFLDGQNVPCMAKGMFGRVLERYAEKGFPGLGLGASWIVGTFIADQSS